MKKTNSRILILMICIICMSTLLSLGENQGKCVETLMAEHICQIAERAYGPVRTSVSWEAEEGETYRISRAAAGDAAYETIFEVKDIEGRFTYIDKNRTIGQQYIYKVEKVTGDKTQIAEHSESPEIVLVAPSGVTASADNGQVTIKWNEVAGAKGYCVFKSEKKDGPFEKLNNVSEISCTDTSIESMKTYYYKVMAYGGKYSESRGPVSEAAACYTKLAAPTVSGSYDKTAQTASITWKSVKGASKYYIYKRSGSGYTKVGESTGLSYTEAISKNGVYQYKVAGVYTADGKDIAGYQSSECTLIVSSIVKPGNGKMIALTFDDGPGAYTQEIVNCLAANNSHATFFVLGNRVGSYSSALRAIYQNGNEVASHTYSHPSLTSLGAEGIKEQMTKTDNAVKNIIGVAPTLMRPPGGAVNSTVKGNVGKPIIMWSIDTLDWKTRNKVETINAVMSKVKDGDIILLHDIHKPTRDAALELIPMLRNEGYQLVTVSELAKAKGYNLQDGRVYYSLR